MPDPLRDGDPRRIGPYRLHAHLGGGGMGQVFLGRSRGGRLVAVKIVHPELARDPRFRRRFATEVEAARKVGGFYTASVVDAAPDGEPPWLATAYVPGLTLHDAVEQHGPLPAESVAALGAGLAEGLAVVHTESLVHRDVKPGNVILAEDGPRLIDFGIARALDATSSTQTRTVLGTAAFMSPEQARGLEVGPPSDVFALGSVLAFAASGRSPFGDGQAHALTYRIVHEEPDLSGLPDGLAAVVEACLDKDPEERPTAEEVLGQLSASPAVGGGGGRWLPEGLTEVIRTQTAQTRVETHADGPDERGGPEKGDARRDKPGERGGTPKAGAQGQPTAAPERFELTTAGQRIGRRIGGLLVGPLVVLGIIVFLSLFADLPESVSFAEAVWTIFVAALTEEPVFQFIAVFLSLGCLLPLPGDGQDLLIVDAQRIAVVDKRWLRWSDRSVSLPWAEVGRVGIEGPNSSGSHTIRAQKKRDGKSVIEIKLDARKGDAAHMLGRIRAALARFAGDTYRET